MPKSQLDSDLLLEHHLTPTFVLDAEGRVAVWNRACECLTGLKSVDVLGTRDHWRGFYQEPRPCVADLILQDQIEVLSELYDAVSDVRVSQEAIAAENWCVMPANGRRLYLSIEAAAIRDHHGKVIGVVETLRDLTTIKAAEAKLRSLAGLDALTGIANRRTFENTLAAEWRRAARAGGSLSLLMVDVDHFKQFNDNLGHQRGDGCLQAVAAALSAETHRAGDFPARYGGEEFAIILPATDRSGAARIGENVRLAIERLAFDHPLSSVGPFVTVSIGMATLSPNVGDHVETLVCFADTALYRAKALGRNRVCAFDDSPPFDVARPSASIEIPTIDETECAECRSDAPVNRQS